MFGRVFVRFNGFHEFTDKKTVVTKTKIVIAAFCYTILVLNFLAIPFAFTFEAKVSVFDADGTVWVKLFGIIPLVKIAARVENDGYANELVLKIGGKEKRFHINADKNDDKSVAKFMEVGFIPYINIVDLNVAAEIGKRNDALFTTLAFGTVRTVTYGILAFLKSSQKIRVRERFVAVYNRDVIATMVNGIINVSVADIIFGYLLYVFSENNKRKRKRVRRILNDNRA